MQAVINVLTAGVALINLAPVIGVSGRGFVQAYGITKEQAADPALRILLRHRAVLFGLIGSLLAGSIATPGMRESAYPLAMMSMVSFVGITAQEGGGNDALARVSRIDVGAIIGLAAAWAMHAMTASA